MVIYEQEESEGYTLSLQGTQGEGARESCEMASPDTTKRAFARSAIARTWLVKGDSRIACLIVVIFSYHSR